jgi:hypothetical protein
MRSRTLLQRIPAIPCLLRRSCPRCGCSPRSSCASSACRNLTQLCLGNMCHVCHGKVQGRNRRACLPVRPSFCAQHALPGCYCRLCGRSCLLPRRHAEVCSFQGGIRTSSSGSSHLPNAWDAPGHQWDDFRVTTGHRACCEELVVFDAGDKAPMRLPNVSADSWSATCTAGCNANASCLAAARAQKRPAGLRWLPALQQTPQPQQAGCRRCPAACRQLQSECLVTPVLPMPHPSCLLYAQ